MFPICANCQIEIRWRPTILDGIAYCCAGCAEGGPCICDYAQLPELSERTSQPVRFIRFKIFQYA